MAAPFIAVAAGLIPVVSSNLDAVGYADGTLIIAFHRGGVYAYDGVPVSEYWGLMHASSHGRYFHAYIKGCYDYRRIN